MSSTEPSPEPSTESCVFCRIVAGELPSRQVHADDAAVAFLDLAPFHRGHTLVVPRAHVVDLLDGPGTLAALGPAVDATAALLVDRLGADGINLFSSAGAVAGQEVPHLHLHLVPRYADRPGVRALFDRDADDSAEALDAVHRKLTG